MYKKGHIHFMGIGGIGMSGIAKILKHQGYKISGCDLDLEQKSIEELKEIGCSIYRGNNTPLCHDESIDILVYSSAIYINNPEILTAQQKGIPIISRALMLAEIMRTKYSIAITGSHGKTTTTSLISHILIEASKNPTIIIGGHLKNISTNALFGSGDFLVAEADESDRSFLRLYPTIAIVTNIDLEHLDTYQDLNDIKETFKQFLSNLPFYGKAIVCNDDPNINSILPLSHIKTTKYGFNTEADIFAKDIILEKDHSIFNVYLKHEKLLGSVCLSMPGKHNVLNALAAIAVSNDLDIPFSIAANALKNFKGIDRRFSFKGIYNGAEIFDDYGHHPTEIYHTLIVARKRAQKRLIVIFQPHRYTRTHKLWQEFIDLLAYSSIIDQLIITDIYPAGENPIENINSMNLVQAIKQKQPACSAEYIGLDTEKTTDFDSILSYIKDNAQEGDLVLLLGAGKVNKIAQYLQS